MDLFEHYKTGYEDTRLNDCSMEKIRTIDILNRVIDKPLARILDIGGGTGVYAFYLASRGHRVDLIDLVPEHIEIALKKQRHAKQKLSAISPGDALNLDYEDNSFDYVLLFGPLYHLTEFKDRAKALSETHRVLKTGGKILAVGISKYASFLDGYMNNLVDDPQFIPMMEQYLIDGQHRNNTDNPFYFTSTIFNHPVEFGKEIETLHFRNLKNFSIESFSSYIPDIEKKLINEDYKQTLLGQLRKVEHEPSIIGLSPHYMVVAEK